MTANFKDPKTGTLYYVNAFSMKIIDGESIYYAFNQPLIGDSGEMLDFIPKSEQDSKNQAKHIIAGGVSIEQSKEKYDKQAAHFKQVSKDHAKSGESKELRKKVIDKQFGVMGLEKKK